MLNNKLCLTSVVEFLRRGRVDRGTGGGKGVVVVDSSKRKVGASSTGGAVSGSTGRVMNASGASARALLYGCLRFVAAIKTHDDMLFAANRVSFFYFCRRFLGVGASSTGGAVSGYTGRVMNESGASARVF